MEAHPEVVVALQASGLAPELPLLSELKLASKTVVWANDVDTPSERKTQANMRTKAPDRGAICFSVEAELDGESAEGRPEVGLHSPRGGSVEKVWRTAVRFG